MKNVKQRSNFGMQVLEIVGHLGNCSRQRGSWLWVLPNFPLRERVAFLSPRGKLRALHLHPLWVGWKQLLQREMKMWGLGAKILSCEIVGSKEGICNA